LGDKGFTAETLRRREVKLILNRRLGIEEKAIGRKRTQRVERTGLSLTLTLSLGEREKRSGSLVQWVNHGFQCPVS
jgi:hypothetical protein